MYDVGRLGDGQMYYHNKEPRINSRSFTCAPLDFPSLSQVVLGRGGADLDPSDVPPGPAAASARGSHLLLRPRGLLRHAGPRECLDAHPGLRLDRGAGRRLREQLPLLRELLPRGSVHLFKGSVLEPVQPRQSFLEAFEAINSLEMAKEGF